MHSSPLIKTNPKDTRQKNVIMGWGRLWVFLVFALCCNSLYAREFTVASKRFTESYVLAELISKTIEDKANIVVNRKQGMGSTGIVFNALKEGEIDLYPEYWGTLTHEILKSNEKLTLDQVNQQLLPMGIKAGYFLGFNNTYALVMSKKLATQLNIHTITDLKNHQNLRLGLSQEFLARKDGWNGLAKAYHLEALKPIGLEHGLAYQAIANNQIDLIDAYSTDSMLIKEGYELLKDDENYFTSYDALLLYRIKAVEKNSKMMAGLDALTGALSEKTMQSLNAQVEIEGKNPVDVVNHYYRVRDKTLAQTEDKPPLKPWSHLFRFLDGFLTLDFLRISYQHAVLVFASLGIAIVLGIPLGVWVYAKPKSGRYVLSGIGVIQTVPALALLSFLILIMHSIGFLPAFTALLMYALLPIVESTYSGLKLVDPAVKEASKALGAGFWIQLIKIEIPLCRPALFSGIQVAAVWTTGTATIAAFVGAGGYGERIAQGLSTNNTELMLQGALPAAVFSLVVRWLITLVGQLGVEH
jgi:osmoprotectant transport system permease protein